MEIVHSVLDYLLHFEVHLDFVITHYHAWTYLILFLIIFIETGLVIMPFLPGDSLLFMIGAFASRGTFEFWTISTTLFIAAVIGDSVNYTIGKYIGPKVFSKETGPLFHKEHLDRAFHFYEKYGMKAIILARFIPIVRTFAPFVAGIGRMNYKKFMTFNIIGGLLWIYVFIAAGYFFGDLPAVKNNFKIVMLAIIFISILPGVIEYYREHQKKKVA